MPSRKYALYTLVLLISLVALACGDDETSNNQNETNNGTDNNGTGNNGEANNGDANNGDVNNGEANNGDVNNGDNNHGEVQMRSLELTLEGLPVLGDGYVYEGWLIIEGSPVSTGRFTVESQESAHLQSFTLEAAQVDAATAFVLTIEPAQGDDPAPASTHVLAGDIVNGAADLTVQHSAALGDDFQAAAGQFVLATPTSPAPESDEGQGIWFLTLGDDGPEAGLELPTLPAGWVYEGWVVDLSGDSPVPVSTGTFTSVMGADSDGPGSAAGPAGAPPFPGQDFIDPARDLTQDHMVVISVEPFPDNSPMPFQLKPLAAVIEGEPGTDQPKSLNQVIAENTIMGEAQWGEANSLEVSYQGLPALGDDYVYEGWVIVEGSPVSTGRFTVDAQGQPSQTQVTLSGEQRAAATFVLTIEPAVGDDPAPAETHVLAGDFTDGSAPLEIAHPAALGTNFQDASGSFLLATPTTPPPVEDEDQGIWFLQLGEDGPEAGLELPILPAGWAYEGWVVDLSGDSPLPISTGTFTSVMGADSDGAGAAAGPAGAPPFPGQDFIDPARVLSADHMAVISIEPSPDDSPAPFQLKPLGALIGEEDVQTLENIIQGNSISGSLEVK